MDVKLIKMMMISLQRDIESASHVTISMPYRISYDTNDTDFKLLSILHYPRLSWLTNSTVA